MLPVDVQDTTGGLDLLLPLLLCCMLPMMFRQPQSSRPSFETDSWFVTYDIQEAYDAIIKETDEWRKKAEERKSKSRFSFLSRRKPMIFIVDEAVAPRLYRVRDNRAGEISFELTEVGDGGTSIKATYDLRAKSLIQNFKAKLPVKIPASGSKTCPSCGKEIMPDFKTCPYCGEKLDKVE